MREIALMLLVALSIPLVFKRPLWALAIYLGGNVLRPEMFFWGGTKGSYIFMVYYGLIIVASICSGYLGDAGRIRTREFFLMVWLLIAILVSTAFAQYPTMRGSYYLIEMIKSFVLCAFMYVIVRDFDDLKRLQNVLLGCFAFLGVWGIDQQFRGNERLEGLGGAAWGDSNDVAAVFVMFLPVALARTFTAETGKERFKASLIAAIIVVLIVCTKSRGGLLGMVTSMVSYGYFSRNMRKVLWATLVIAVVVTPFVTESYVERLKTMQSEEALDPSAKGRLILWRLGLKVFADNPLLGTGFLTYPSAKMRYQQDFSYLEPAVEASIFRSNQPKVTHNTYIQMLSDCGLFGAIPHFLLVMGGVFTGLKARSLCSQFTDRKEQLTWLCGLCAGIGGYAVCIITIDSILIPFVYIQLVCVGILSRSLDTATRTDNAVTLA